MRLQLILCLLVACAPDDPLDIELLPDAGIDAAPMDAAACSTEPTHGCCDLLPDTNAVAACEAAAQPPDVCGVLVCQQADCTNVPVHFCTPASDAGVADAPVAE